MVAPRKLDYSCDLDPYRHVWAGVALPCIFGTQRFVHIAAFRFFERGEFENKKGRTLIRVYNKYLLAVMAGNLLKKRKREGGQIPTASMADIAFLLLIFFLVTTTIDVDTGIGMTLPPKLEENQEPPPVRDRNMLKILVNAQGQVLLEERPATIAMIREEVIKHIMNNGEDPGYSESPNRAVVSFKTDMETPYNIYIEILDEIWMAYFTIWDSEARQLGFPDYETYRAALGPNDENVIRERIKAQLSIAEPDRS